MESVGPETRETLLFSTDLVETQGAGSGPGPWSLTDNLINRLVVYSFERGSSPRASLRATSGVSDKGQSSLGVVGPRRLSGYSLHSVLRQSLQ